MPLRRILLLWLVSSATIGLLLNWHFRFNAAADTISYLEVANKYAQGKISDAIVLYWSPAYSWTLIPIVRFPRVEQVPLGHALQFVLLLFVMWATWRLLSLLHRAGSSLNVAATTLVLGVGLASALVVIPVRYLTPDLLVLGVVLWLISRIGKEAAGIDDGVVHRLLTGMLWGIAYLVRTYVAPFGAMTLILAELIVRDQNAATRRLRRLGVYLAGFLVIAGPWMGVLSHKERQLTWGESGRNNLLAQLPRREIQAPEWPQLLASGHIRNFERPFSLTSPESYDVTLGGRYQYGNLLYGYSRLVLGNLEAMFFGFFPLDLPLYWPLGILAALAGAAFAPISRPQRMNERISTWLLCGAIVGLLMFILVHVESRYLAPFIVLLAASIAGRSSQDPQTSQQGWMRIVAYVGMLFWLSPFVVWLNGLRTSQAVHPEATTAAANWLEHNGHRYAVVGPTYDLGLPAWLSRTELVASVNVTETTAATCDTIAKSLRELQVSAVLGLRGTSECGPWQAIPGTSWTSWNVSEAATFNQERERNASGNSTNTVNTGTQGGEEPRSSRRRDVIPVAVLLVL